MPPLPRLCDPELFIHFHDAIKDPLYRPNDDYSNLRKRFMPPFAALTKRGDAILKVKLLEILYEYFGSDNVALINNIFDLVVSNATCRHLALATNCIYILVYPREKNLMTSGGAMFGKRTGLPFSLSASCGTTTTRN